MDNERAASRRPPILAQRDRERLPRVPAPAVAVSAVPPLLPVLEVAAEALPAPAVVEPALLPVALWVLVPLVLDSIEWVPTEPLLPEPDMPEPDMLEPDWPPIWPVCPDWPLIWPPWLLCPERD